MEKTEFATSTLTLTEVLKRGSSGRKKKIIMGRLSFKRLKRKENGKLCG